MAIAPISASSASVNATQAVRPPREAEPPQRAEGDRRPENEIATVYQAAQPKPTVNSNGQAIGTLLNVSA